MLQLIGWLGCAYLVVKALELQSRADPNGWTRAATAVALLSSITFGVLIAQQGSNMSAAMSSVYGGSGSSNSPLREGLTTDAPIEEMLTTEPTEPTNDMVPDDFSSGVE